jgi:hypothetical protein
VKAEHCQRRSKSPVGFFLSRFFKHFKKQIKKLKLKTKDDSHEEIEKAIKNAYKHKDMLIQTAVCSEHSCNGAFIGTL